MLSGLFTGPTVIFRQSGFNLKLTPYLTSTYTFLPHPNDETSGRFGLSFLPERSDRFFEIYAAIVLNANG
jgi:hypothetical protein